MSDPSAGVGGSGGGGGWGLLLSLLILFPVLIQEVRIFPELMVTYYSSDGQTFIWTFFFFLDGGEEGCQPSRLG